jgi:flavin reductase (DIM6/NTAB) family NADH-FMN oxidoreductase RutF
MTSPMSRDEERRYRQTIGHFATGVAIVTAHSPDGPVGMTANALCSLSLAPPLLLVCFERSARTLPFIEAAGRFAVNILRHEQHALSGTFASKRPEHEKFDGVRWRSHAGAPVLQDALAWLTCDLHQTHGGGDHTICIGAVTDMQHEQGRPLVWYRGSYGTLADEAPAEARLPN